MATKNLSPIYDPCRWGIPLEAIASLPEGITLPDWLTGVGGGSGEVLIVTIGDVEGLNLRAEPGLNTRIIGLLPNGTRVRKLEGPRIVDNVPWVRVRGEINGQPVEGWVSQLFVRTG